VKLKLALTVADYSSLPGDEEGLGALGAGHFEDLMSDWLIDAISIVRMDFEEPSLQRRVSKLVG